MKKGKTFTAFSFVSLHGMKKWITIHVFISLLLFSSVERVHAQCSICTKTASQLGEKPAEGLNSGILYLMFAPLAIGGVIGYRWWQREKSIMQQEQQGQ